MKRFRAAEPKPCEVVHPRQCCFQVLAIHEREAARSQRVLQSLDTGDVGLRRLHAGLPRHHTHTRFYCRVASGMISSIPNDCYTDRGIE